MTQAYSNSCNSTWLRVIAILPPSPWLTIIAILPQSQSTPHKRVSLPCTLFITVLDLGQFLSNLCFFDFACCAPYSSPHNKHFYPWVSHTFSTSQAFARMAKIAESFWNSPIKAWPPSTKPHPGLGKQGCTARQNFNCELLRHSCESLLEHWCMHRWIDAGRRQRSKPWAPLASNTWLRSTYRASLPPETGVEAKAKMHAAL